VVLQGARGVDGRARREEVEHIGGGGRHRCAEPGSGLLGMLIFFSRNTPRGAGARSEGKYFIILFYFILFYFIHFILFYFILFILFILFYLFYFFLIF
jgi:hypothetical protein